MARAISKAGIETIIFVFVVEHMTDKMPTIEIDGNEVEYTDKFSMRGNKSDNAAQLAAEKKFGKNCMVIHTQKIEGEKLTLSAEKFLAHSSVCKEGEKYGHDTITCEFKVTYLSVMFRDASGMHTSTLVYNGETTASKLLNFAREATGSKMCVVKDSYVITERRWMYRSTYETLATAMNKKTEGEE